MNNYQVISEKKKDGSPHYGGDDRVCATIMEWKISDIVQYEEAVDAMESRVAKIRNDSAPEMIWFLEHPPLYTSGTSSKKEDLLDERFPVISTGRGGQYTYHGPGQRIAYVMLDLQKRKPDLKKYVYSLEEVIIRTIAHFGINGVRRKGRVGIWVKNENKESKIAAIGIRVRKWVTYHGIALNVCPDLEHFSGIVPCGIKDHGVTSLKDLDIDVTMRDVDKVLKQKFIEVLQPVVKRGS